MAKADEKGGQDRRRGGGLTASVSRFNRPPPLCIPSVASRFIRPTVYRMALGTAKGIFEIEFEPIATHGIASMNGNTCQRGLSISGVQVLQGYLAL